jgi:hypothetical protein
VVTDPLTGLPLYTGRKSVTQFELTDAEANKYYVLCADLSTVAKAGYGYNMVNVEDADYYDEEAAAHIKAIALNGYWGTESGIGSLENVKELLRKEKAAGKNDLTNEQINSLTDGMALSITQAAVWTYGDSGSNTIDKSSLLRYYWQSDRAIDFLSVNQRKVSDVLYQTLINLTDDDPAAVKNETTTLITEDNFASEAAIVIRDKTEKTDADGNDIYNADVSFTLEMQPSVINDDLIVTVKDNDGNVIGTKRLAGDNETSIFGEAAYADSEIDENGNTVYTLRGLEIAEGVAITLNLTGTQHLNKGVYLYSAAVYDKTQTYVGVAEGTRNVNLAVNLKFEVEGPDIALSHTRKTTTVSETEKYSEPTVYAEIEVTPDPDPTPSSSGSGSGSSKTIGNPAVPLASAVVPEEVYTEIVDEQVPEALLMIPRTGDNLMSFVAASMISGLGLAVLTIFGKREREEA